MSKTPYNTLKERMRMAKAQKGGGSPFSKREEKAPSATTALSTAIHATDPKASHPASNRK